MVQLEGEPPGLSQNSSDFKTRFLIPIEIPDALFDTRFKITEDVNSDVNTVGCSEADAPVFENMLKQWNTPYLRVEPGGAQDDHGAFDQVRNDYEVFATIHGLEDNRKLVKMLTNSPELFSKPLGVSFNFSDPALIVRLAGTMDSEDVELIRPLLTGSASIFRVKKKLLEGKLSPVEYDQFKNALDCVLTIAEQKHWAAVYKQ